MCREGLVKVDEDWGEAGEEGIGPAAVWYVAVRSMEWVGLCVG